MSGPEKSIDILHLLFAFKESKDVLGGNIAVSWVPIQGAPGKMLGSGGRGEPEGPAQKEWQIGPSSEGPCSRFLIPSPFQIFQRAPQTQETLAFGMGRREVEGLKPTRRGVGAPETPRVRKGGQSESPASVKFSASFPTKLGNAL